jgi:hypothetical protein
MKRREEKACDAYRHFADSAENSGSLQLIIASFGDCLCLLSRYNLVPLMRSQEARQKAQAFTIFETVQNSRNLQDILVIATSDSKKSFFIHKLICAHPDAFDGRTEAPPVLFNIMTTWFGKFKDAPSRFSAMDDALKQRQDYFLVQRHKKIDFIRRVGLNWPPATRDEFLKTIKTTKLTKLKTPYPEAKHWICESATIDNKWRDYLQNDPRAQPDRRLPRRPIFCLDPAKLQLDIQADESELVYDTESGELVLLALRNFCGDDNLLSHIDDIVKQAVEYRRSIRVCL